MGIRNSLKLRLMRMNVWNWSTSAALNESHGENWYIREKKALADALFLASYKDIDVEEN